MVSPELLRRYPFFAGLTHENIVTMANTAEELAVHAGHAFFRADEALCCLYLVLEGAVGVVIELPDQTIEQPVSGQLTGALHTRDVVMSTVGPGEVFGWSALVPPFTATAAAKALTPCRVISFSCADLFNVFAEDCRFGYLVMQKAAQIIRGRLHDMHIQSLSYLVD
jgi:CRP-like cAMP-binding protein